MMEMKIKIDVPELVAAVEKLAAAIDKTALNITVPNEGTLNFNIRPATLPLLPHLCRRLPLLHPLLPLHRLPHPRPRLPHRL